MFCGKCGKEINEKESFCTWCGAPNPAYVESDSINTINTTFFDSDNEETVSINSITQPYAEMGSTNNITQPYEKMEPYGNGKTKSIKRRKKPIMLICIIVGALLVVGVLAFFIFRNSDGYKYKKQIDIANNYFEELDYENAIVAYEEAIKINPKSEDAYIDLADVYIAMADADIESKDYIEGIDNYNKAIETYDRICEFEPESKAANLGKADVYMMIADCEVAGINNTDKEYNAAIEECDKALDSLEIINDNDDSEVLEKIEVVERKIDELQEELDAYKKEIERLKAEEEARKKAEEAKRKEERKRAEEEARNTKVDNSCSDWEYTDAYDVATFEYVFAANSSADKVTFIPESDSVFISTKSYISNGSSEYTDVHSSFYVSLYNLDTSEYVGGYEGYCDNVEGGVEFDVIPGYTYSLSVEAGDYTKGEVLIGHGHVYGVSDYRLDNERTNSKDVFEYYLAKPDGELSELNYPKHSDEDFSTIAYSNCIVCYRSDFYHAGDDIGDSLSIFVYDDAGILLYDAMYIAFGKSDTARSIVLDRDKEDYVDHIYYYKNILIEYYNEKAGTEYNYHDELMIYKNNGWNITYK